MRSAASTANSNPELFRRPMIDIKPLHRNRFSGHEMLPSLACAPYLSWDEHLDSIQSRLRNERGKNFGKSLGTGRDGFWLLLLLLKIFIIIIITITFQSLLQDSSRKFFENQGEGNNLFNSTQHHGEFLAVSFFYLFKVEVNSFLYIPSRKCNTVTGGWNERTVST